MHAEVQFLAKRILMISLLEPLHCGNHRRQLGGTFQNYCPDLKLKY